MELFNQITPTMVYASIAAYLYLVILSVIEQFLNTRDTSGNFLIYTFRTLAYLIAALGGVYLIGEKFGFEDPVNFVSIFTVTYCIISIGIRITSVMNMRVNTAPFLAYVYYPTLLIFWIFMSSISTNTVNNIMQLRNCISQLGNLHTFRRLPKWYVCFINKLYWIGLNINYRSKDLDFMENTYKYSSIKYERSLGRSKNVKETMESLIDSEVFKEISNEIKNKHKELSEVIDKVDKNPTVAGSEIISRKIKEKEYAEVSENLGVKTLITDRQKKISDDTSSDKKE